jgi:hypothetical protein
MRTVINRQGKSRIHSPADFPDHPDLVFTKAPDKPPEHPVIPVPGYIIEKVDQRIRIVSLFCQFTFEFFGFRWLGPASGSVVSALTGKRRIDGFKEIGSRIRPF